MHLANIGAVLFMHRMADPSGKELLVIVYTSGRWYYQEHVTYRPDPHRDERDIAWTILADSDSPTPFRYSEQPLALQLPGDPPRGSVTLYAGQLDPNNPRHFTLPYSVNGTPAGVIDGYLDNRAMLRLRINGQFATYPTF
jgi:hypothetical protein